MGEKLTGRQELFAQHYSLTGNGTRAAIQAGCRNPNSAHVRADRWLRKTTVRDRIEEIREEAFEGVKWSIIKGLYGELELGLESGRNYKRASRALRLMQRVGIFHGES